MSRACVLRASFSLAFLLVLVVALPTSFAQRAGFHGGGFGVHGGGFGGFHNGGGSHGFNSARFHNGLGGFRGRGFDGFRRNGFRNGPFFGFGYPWYAWNFAFGVSPYWDPWFWGYTPWGVPDPYYYPYDYPSGDGYYRRYDDYDRCRPDYRHPDNGCTDNSPSGPNRESTPAKPLSAPDRYRDRHNLTGDVEDYRSPDASQVFTTPKFQVISSTPQNSSELRPPVKNAIQLLRAMPPAARERYLNSDVYDSFSPQERDLLNRAFDPLK